MVSGKCRVQLLNPLSPRLDSMCCIRLKRLVITERELKKRRYTSYQPADVLGFGCRFAVSAVPLLLTSPCGVRVRPGSVKTSFEDVRLCRMRVRVAPAGQCANRIGSWTLGFNPYTDRQDFSVSEQALSTVPTEQTVGLMRYSVSGPASAPLTLEWHPQPHEWASRWHPLASRGSSMWFGGIALAFQCMDRNQHSDISADEFSASCFVEGRIVLRGVSTPRTFTYRSAVRDLLENVHLGGYSGTHQFFLKADKFAKSRMVSDLFVFKGTVRTYPDSSAG